MKIQGVAPAGRITFTLALMIVVAALMLTVVSVRAQQDTDGQERITLSPSSDSFKIDAGEVRNGSMKVINDGDVAYDITVYARPYSVSNEAYDPSFSEEKPNTNLYKWVQFEKTKYHIEPEQTVEVKYTIRVPQDAAPGGNYGVLFAETQDREIGSTGVARQKRVGKVIYATVNGDYKTGGRFEEFILPMWQTRPPFVSGARVTNTGNADFNTSVETTAKDVFGRTKFSYVGDPIVLPDTTRLIEMKWDDSPSFGLFSVSQKVEFLDQKNENSGWVLIAPRWFPLLLIGVVLAGVGYAVLQRRSNRR